ncbi:MAG: helix-turn-helix transcriptional regulator [Bacteroidia bacterium]
MNFRSEKILIHFGKHLKKMRAKKGVTQEELAYNSGISLSQIARIETGKINPTLCTLLEIAKYLKISKKEFFDF